MGSGFPTTPTTGKGGKVLIPMSDGVLLNAVAMTKQASYSYKGKTIANRMYLLGTGKTLINRRPDIDVPAVVNIDCIFSGLLIQAHADVEKLQTTAGEIVYDGTLTAVAADASVSFSRPASGEGAWLAVHVKKSDGSVSVTKGTDTSGTAGVGGLLTTWGSSAGQKPLIPTTDLLIGMIPIDSTSAVLDESDVSYDDRETPVAGQMCPNIGGYLVNEGMELLECHVGALAREVKFSGYYLDTVLTQVNSAKGWSVTPSATNVTENTLGNEYSQSEISGWAFTFEALADNPYILDIMLNRQGFCAARLVYPNGGYFQGAATITATFNNQTGQFNNVPVSGSFLDQPVFV